jgi:lipopolysaccharide export system protein LptA
LAIGSAAVAVEDNASPTAKEITIRADRLVTDIKDRKAEFSGGVVANQGSNTISADRLIVFYSADGGADKPQESIQRIEAYGNVRIVFDNRNAVSEKAIYSPGERKLILSGPGTKIISGQDEIVGQEIVFDRERQTVNIESHGKGQVNAVIRSNQRGLN